MKKKGIAKSEGKDLAYLENVPDDMRKMLKQIPPSKWPQIMLSAGILSDKSFELQDKILKRMGVSQSVQAVQYVKYNITGDRVVEDTSYYTKMYYWLQSLISGYLYDTIEIRDETRLKGLKDYHVIQKLFERTSNTLPTIIRYEHEVLGKKLLLSIPEGLDVTTFWKKCGSQLTKVHKEFYKKSYRGRPLEKESRGKRILQILTEYKGRKLSIEELSDLASEKLAETGEDISSSTIKRHYRNELRTIKKGEK